MNRYIIKKYVVAKSLQQALQKEKSARPDEILKDENQSESEPKVDAIGFSLEGDGYYYSPYLKRKKKRSKRK